MGTAFNDYLQPLNAPVTDTQGAVSAYDFFSQHDRSSIMLSKIRNFSFNQGSGGTITLGGTNNGNGLLLVKDSSGSTIVTANNAGIAITGGNISISDSSGSTVIDSTGLNSIGQFSKGQVVYSTPQTTTSSYSDATGSSFTITTSRDIIVLFNITVTTVSTGQNYIYNGYGVQTRLYDSFLGGAAIDMATSFGANATLANISGGTITGFTYRASSSPSSISALLLVQAGTHNYTLQYGAYAGGTAELDTYIVNYAILGK